MTQDFSLTPYRRKQKIQARNVTRENLRKRNCISCTPGQNRKERND